MITPSTINSIGSIVTWEGTITNDSANTNTLTTVFTVPADFVLFIDPILPKGTYTPLTKTWVVECLPHESLQFKLVLQMTAATGGFGFTYNFIATLTGLDTNAGNNVLNNTVLYEALTCDPMGSVSSTSFQCLCVDISENATPCSQGTSEFRLDLLSITNGENNFWETATGKGGFMPIDPTLPITFKASLWCILGLDEFEIGCATLYTIYPQLVDKDIFDHVPSVVAYADLSLADIAVLSAQYPAITLSDYCWGLIRNGDGDLTGGWIVDCNDKQDTRTIYFCSEVDCGDIVNNCPECLQNQLPADIQVMLAALVISDEYEPQLGDVIFVQHPNAQSVYKYTALGWVRDSCGCIYKISQDADNLLILGTDNAPYISLDEIGAVVGDHWGDEFVHHLGGSISTGEGTIPDPLYVPPTIVEVADTSDINMSITGDGLMSPYVISGVVNEGDPLPVYATGTPGSTLNFIPLADLFADTCPTGFTTACYEVISYPTDVYDGVSIILPNLVYNVLSTAPSGTHYINVARTCQNVPC